MRRALLCALALGGCGTSTAVRIDLDLEAGVASPVELRVALYGDGPIGAPHKVELDGKMLPGSFLVLPPNASTPDFRMRIDGVDGTGALLSQAAGDTPVQPDGIARYALTLTAGPLQDNDGDGVPDLIDDCADTPDPLQDCAAPRSDLSGLADAGAPDLATPECPATALLCEGWESGVLGPWGLSMGGPVPASVAVDAAQAHKGQFSLHGRAPAMGPNNDSFASVQRDFTASATGLTAVRTWLYTEDLPGDFDLYFILSDGAGASYSVGGATKIDPGDWVITHTNGADVYAPMQVPLGRWVCVELQVLLAAQPPRGHLALLVDGQPVIDQTYDTSGAVGGLTRIQIGVARDTGVQPVSEWFDDLVVAEAPIGCN